MTRPVRLKASQTPNSASTVFPVPGRGSDHDRGPRQGGCHGIALEVIQGEWVKRFKTAQFRARRRFEWSLRQFVSVFGDCGAAAVAVGFHRRTQIGAPDEV